MISTIDSEKPNPPSPSAARLLTPTDRLQKLRAMSVAELSARVRYRVRTRIERERHRRGHFARSDRLKHALDQPRSADWQERLLERRVEPRARFFAGTRARHQMQRLFDTAYAGERADARLEAERVRKHQIGFFGHTFRFGGVIDWHADPVTGRQWPRVYHAEVPVHGGDVGFGDVKHVWELNRHQFLVDLAKIYFLDGSAADAAEMRALVTDWLDKNPYGTGVSWACALEPAFRTLSWLWSYHLCLDDPQLDAIVHARWLAGFYDHARFLHHHLELYSSPFNHLIGEAAALYMLGVLFPEFREAGGWRARGRHILESRLADQFYQDGGSVEQSTFYHHATLGFYLLAVLLGRENGEEFAAPVFRAIERAIEFSMCLMQPDGRVPRIGGGDDGKPIRLQHLSFWDFRPYQAIGAVMFNRPDFRYASGRFHEDALWMLGPDGLARFAGLAAEPPREVTISLPRSGYFVFRNGWTEGSDYVCFDCGEQARGLRTDSVPSAAHGHADCLSVLVWLGGRPVLVDPGFYCYNGDPVWEVHFRKTAAHNTLRVDGRDQAQHIAKMAWCRTYRAAVDRVQTDAGGSFVTGWHDGYTRLQHGGVVHRRTVWLRPGGYVVIADELTGEGAHSAEWTYQFAPGRAVLAGPSTLAFDEFAEMAWAASHPLSADLREGGTGPDEGWVAPSLGVRVAAPRLRLRADYPGARMVVLSVLADRSAPLESWHVCPYRGDTHGCVAILIEGRESRDVVIGRTAPEAAVEGVFTTDAPIAVYSERPGRPPEMHRIGGTYARSSRSTPSSGADVLEPSPREEPR